MGLPWRHALKTLTLTVCLGVWTQRTSAQGAGAEVTDARVGETATLPAPVTADIQRFVWFRGRVVNPLQAICYYSVSPPEQVNGPPYTGRETCRSDGSLQIRDLLTNYTGYYTVYVEPRGAIGVTATRHLRVYASEAGGNTIWTTAVSIPERGAPPAADAPCTSWWVTLAVASGMLLGAALVVLGVVLFYERRLKKVNGVTPGGSPRVISEPSLKYENVENGNQARTAAQSPEADHTYMALKHGDQTTYAHLQRPQN